MVLLLLAFIVLMPVCAAGSIEEFLKELPLENVKVLEKEAFYSHIYEVMFEQPIDHNNPDMGSFSQRLYISHVDETRPVVLVTEGYSAGYYYTSEPAAMLKCNQIIAEHRYFGESAPDSIQWQYLTTWQASADYHRIIGKFRKFYTDKWITTGISKGGQTLIFHSFYFPDDADVRIPYVAPLNNSTEDSRIYDFLDHVGSKDCRNRIYKFQKYLLKNQDIFRPEFAKFSERRNYTYEIVGGVEKAFEYCVLEYPFAFWQWGYASCSQIPGKKSEPSEVILHMNTVAGFDYFTDEFINEYRPFYYQAYTEMGYYGYNLDDFKAYLKYVNDPGFGFALPEGEEISFDNTLLTKVDKYMKTDAKDFIFIYGEYDTWSATAVDLGDNNLSKVFYNKKGSHRTRIKYAP